MKKILYISLFVALLIPFTINSQTFDKGTVAISAGYGFPNLVILPFRIAYKIADYNNVAFSGFGPALFRAEYGITKKIGLGLSGGYSTMSVGYTYKDWDIYKGQKIDYHAKVTWTSPSAGLRLNLHFANSEKADPYIGIGGGWTGNKFSYTDDSPWEDKYPKPGVGSFYFNFGIGMRYYFVPNAGMYFEAGWDKAALVQLGVVVRFQAVK